MIVYADADIFVVDKPAGLVVHPSTGHPDDTLLHALAGHASRGGEAGSLHLVHRLDKETSGLLVVARSPRAQRYLAYQWRHQTAVKRYLALVHDHPAPSDGLVELPLARDPLDRRRVVPSPEGKPSRTRYTTLARYDGFSLLEVYLETGRMHQIRAHLAALGHPVAGDRVYGPEAAAAPDGLARHFLHAHSLTIRLPSTRQCREFRSPLPPDLAAVLDQMSATRRTSRDTPYIRGVISHCQAGDQIGLQCFITMGDFRPEAGILVQAPRTPKAIKS